MPITHDEESAHRASGSIMVVVVAQFVGSVALLVPSGLFLAEELQLHHSYPSTYRTLHPAVYLYYVILPISFSLVGIVTSIGLSLLREWARKSALFLATIPAAVYVEVLILRPPSVFPRRVGDIYLYAVAGALCLLIPLSIWWLILFTRPGVKAQFQSRKATRS